MNNRKSLPPGRHWKDKPHIFAGKDLLAGGSWLGVNDDGVVNIQDIIMVIGSILGTVDLGDNEPLADINQDGTVDILDIVQIINIILNG